MEKINSKGRGRPKLLNDNLKLSIDSYKRAYPHWSARKVLDAIHRTLFDRYKLKYPKWTDEKIEARIKLPGVNRVQRYIREVAGESPSCLDQPWHLGLMCKPKYQVPPEAIPDILAVQEYCEKEHPDVPLFVKGEPVTIRQALWIARLHGITSIMDAGKQKGKNKNLDLWGWLWAWSKAYAQCERLSLATTKFDKAIWKGAIPVSANNAIDLFYPDDTLETVIEINEKEGEK